MGTCPVNVDWIDDGAEEANWKDCPITVRQANCTICGTSTMHTNRCQKHWYVCVNCYPSGCVLLEPENPNPTIGKVTWV